MNVDAMTSPENASAAEHAGPDHVRAQFDELKNAIDSAAATLDALSDDNARLEVEIAAIHASTSWRITKPLRALSRLIARLRPR